MPSSIVTKYQQYDLSSQQAQHDHPNLIEAANLLQQQSDRRAEDEQHHIRQQS
jgi:hypothetical protein